MRNGRSVLYQTVSGIIFLFFILFGWYISTRVTVINGDWGWSIRNGWQDVHHWVNHDTYTWESTRQHLSHAEWLFDVFLYYWTVIFHGLSSVQLLTSLFFVLFLFAISYRQIQNGENIWSVIFFTTIAYVLWVSQGIAPRAQLVTYALMYVYWIDRDARIRWLFLVPIWANAHGEYMLFFAFFFFDNVIMRRNFKSIGWLLIWTIEVWIMMPMHTQSLMYPILTLKSGSIRNDIMEWQSFPFHNPLYMLISISMSIYLWLFWRKEKRLIDIASLCILILMTAQALRNTPLLGVYILVGCHYPALSSMAVSKKFVHMVFATAIIMVVLLPRMPMISPSEKQTVSYIEDHQNITNWYTTIAIGDYMEYADPSFKTYIDGRSDVFAGLNNNSDKNLFTGVFNVLVGTEPPQRLPGYNSINAMAIDRHSLLNTEIQLMPKTWKIALSNSLFDVYIRNK